MRLVAVAALVAVGMVVTACGSGGGTASRSPSGGRSVLVEMSDFRFSPATISLKAGEPVTFQLRNAGALEHEFMAGRQPTPGSGYAQDWLKMAGANTASGHGMGHGGAGMRVAPSTGTALSLTVPAEKGVYEFGCFIPGHYEAGMKGTLVVE